MGSKIGTVLLLASILVQVIMISAITTVSSSPTTKTTTTTTPDPPMNEKIDELEDTTEEPAQVTDADNDQEIPQPSTTRSNEPRRLFVVEILKMLYEQYHGSFKKQVQEIDMKEDRSSTASMLSRQAMMSQLLGAIGADGDRRRLTDWVQNSFNLASIGELTTQFVVSKLGSVNCAAILKPDPEDSLIPRFLLFNDHFVDVPFELPLKPSPTDCLANGRFDPHRKTVVLIHGYLTGYTLVDGLTNIKNRLLDTNKLVTERAMQVLEKFQEATSYNTSRLFVENIEAKLKQQQYNVIIVDWFNGANPVPRSRYIRAAVNAQVVGQLIARFLSHLISSCQTPSSNIQLIGHSLGCHVAGFTGKAMTAVGQRLGKITHLDPVGLCFGRLFSEPRFRLSPNDALETQAIHVSLNLFDNPLDGASSNFLVNGGRDQIGCTGQSELTNSTSSSIALLYDSDAKFRPCSHLRALALYEDDSSSEPGQCQMVGYRCSTYERFLAGKCGKCDATNGQCRLMSMPPIIANFKALPIANYQPAAALQQSSSSSYNNKQFGGNTMRYNSQAAATDNRPTKSLAEGELLGLVDGASNGSIAWLIDDQELNQKIVSTIAKMKPGLVKDKQQQQQPVVQLMGDHSYNEIRRSDRRLSSEHRDKLVQTIEKIRSETRNALAGGFSNFRGANSVSVSMTIPHVSLINEPVTVGKYKSLSRLRGKLHNNHQPTRPSAPAGANLADFLSPDPIPLGGQANPEGSVNMPLYFVGTGPISPYCVNYYQFRMLIAESRVSRLLSSGNLAPNRQAQRGDFATSIGTGGSNNGRQWFGQDTIAAIQRQATNPRDTLHLTVKLTDSEGHFFKGFTLVEDVRTLVRVAPEDKATFAAGGENMIELTMLLNTTRSEPVHISESIVSFYFHGIVLADTIEINYMSNISPLVRARYSSILCPLAINDKHQLVKYVECNKLVARR